MRLAERVFAPHYAAPLARTVAAATSLMAGPSRASESMAALAPGETFEMLDLTGGWAWGIAVAHGLVGYVEAGSLGEAA